MAKKLIVTIELADDGLAEDATLYDCGELHDLIYGIDDGAVRGRVESIKIDEPPIVAEVVADTVERAYTHIATVGDLRRFIDGLPDSAAFESYSGSVESLTNFGLSYGPSCNSYYTKDESFVLTVNNEN